ncbi:MAG: TIGR00730 family Rossman fold protein, partial [Dongiaceae bacterium]
MVSSEKYRVGLGPISVFCGASEYPYNEKNPFREVNLEHQRQIERFGQILAGANIPLIWGAGQTGLMGAVSRSVIDHGGMAIGVSTEHLVNGKEGAQKGIATLLVADSMQSRKMAFNKLSRAFVIFPGGIGTFDEVTEYLLERENGEHHKPIVLVNIDGFYEPLLQYFDELVKTRYMTQQARDMLVVVRNADEILPAITAELLKLEADHHRHTRPIFSNETRIGQHNRIVVRRHFAELPIGRHNYPKCDLGVGSVAIISSSSEAALNYAANAPHRQEIEKLINLLAQYRLPRLIHSGQNSGMKGMIARLAKQQGIPAMGITTKFLESQGHADIHAETLLIADNEQSAEFALKNVSDAIIIGPGAIDSLEKLTDYLTEVDIKESNQRLVIMNVGGHYDGLLNYFLYLIERGYFAPAAMAKLCIAKTAEEVIAQIKSPMPLGNAELLPNKMDLVAAVAADKPRQPAALIHDPNFPRYPVTADSVNLLMEKLG